MSTWWNRGTMGAGGAGGEFKPAPAPGPDLHPAQIDLLEARRRIDSVLTEIDDALRRVGNGRPVFRDELLDLRLLLRVGAA